MIMNDKWPTEVTCLTDFWAGTQQLNIHDWSEQMSHIIIIVKALTSCGTVAFYGHFFLWSAKKKTKKNLKNLRFRS